MVNLESRIVNNFDLVNDYERILLDGTPLIDVRAPVEFAQGAFPGAVNLPLMDDEQRHAVGIKYKQAGQEAAIELGHKLVSGSIKTERIARWADFTNEHPDAIVYCFRGGLRSQIAQQWLAQAGWNRPRIAGGYKAMRQFLLNALETHVSSTSFTVVGGLTGSGKTDVISALTASIDLEGLARHRGSSFGGRTQRQPSQIDFENQLAIELLRRHHAGYLDLAIEDESHLIGRCAVPLALRQKTQQSKLVWVTAGLPERVSRIKRDYIESLAQDYISAFGADAGFEQFESHLKRSLYNLRKRLGLQRYEQLNDRLLAALRRQADTGDFDLHSEWIEPLLTDYYDPMYEHQRQQKSGVIAFEGSTEEVIAHLQSSRN